VHAIIAASGAAAADTAEIEAEDSGDAGLEQTTVLKTLEAFGMLKQLGSKVLVEPVTWLTKITSAFVAPKLQSAVAGYEVAAEPVPSTTFGETKAILRKRNIKVSDVGMIVEMLVELKLCFLHTRWNGGDGGGDGSGGVC